MVYLLRRPRPRAAPQPYHHHPGPPATMRLPHQAAAAQKKSMGVSGVWMMQPAGKSSVTLNARRTSQERSRWAGKRVLAVAKRKKRAAAESKKAAEADEKLRVAAQRREESHHPGHHGGVVGVGKRRVLAPVPVIRFVGGELNRVDREKPDGKEGGDGGQDQFIAERENHGPNPDRPGSSSSPAHAPVPCPRSQRGHDFFDRMLRRRFTQGLCLLIHRAFRSGGMRQRGTPQMACGDSPEGVSGSCDDWPSGACGTCAC